MFEKIENFITWIFKVAKWFILLFFILIVVVSVKSCSTAFDTLDTVKSEAISEHKEKVAQCKVEDWKFSKSSNNYLTIDGTVSCDNGNMTLKVYDGITNEYLGNSSLHFRGGVFDTSVKTPKNPKKLNIEFTIM